MQKVQQGGLRCHCKIVKKLVRRRTKGRVLINTRLVKFYKNSFTRACLQKGLQYDHAKTDPRPHSTATSTAEGLASAVVTMATTAAAAAVVTQWPRQQQWLQWPRQQQQWLRNGHDSSSSTVVIQWPCKNRPPRQRLLRPIG